MGNYKETASRSAAAEQTLRAWPGGNAWTRTDVIRTGGVGLSSGHGAGYAVLHPTLAFPVRPTNHINILLSEKNTGIGDLGKTNRFSGEDIQSSEYECLYTLEAAQR